MWKTFLAYRRINLTGIPLRSMPAGYPNVKQSKMIFTVSNNLYDISRRR
jgi:hypothetical protein